jgi:ornithine cyclodeaminase/alanine dehydrogenase-like protein (mu-crystallin family)
LLSGFTPGRSGRDEITVFANNTGMGLQFAAVGARVLELAAINNLGREIPTDWFLESTPP